MRSHAALAALVLPLLPALGAGQAFETRVLTEEFHAEGAALGELDGDGHIDLVYGPFAWYGPDFERAVELYTPAPVDPLGYSDHFFDWVRDLDGDGDGDVLVVGFPGRQAWWFENPGERVNGWARHLIADGVANESPALADLDDDGVEELVFHRGAELVYATPRADDARAPWTLQVIGDAGHASPYVHGLGVGDVDADGRPDVLEHRALWLQPAAGPASGAWQREEHSFGGRRGGAQMLVHDVDGDGDSDVVSSLDAHGWGLAWFEQVEAAGARRFDMHLIMDDEPEDSAHGLVFSQLHALALADVDGDGLEDVVTGKRYWAHGPNGDADPGGAAVIYWFELAREEQGVDFIPHLVHDDSGVGTQVAVGDIDGDGRVDLLSGNKKGFAFHLQRDEPDELGRLPRSAGALPRGADGRALNTDFETGDLSDWTASGDAWEGQPAQGDAPWARGRGQHSHHAGEFWLGGYEHHRTDLHQGTLTSAPFELTQPWASFLVGGGSSELTAVELVRARDEQVLYRASGANHEGMQPVRVDLSAYLGETLLVRVIDESSVAWGHINFDDLRLHEHEPLFALHAGVPPPPDPVQNRGLTPELARAAMRVPDGFHVDLVSSEPELHQPIALAIDSMGRLWVAEAHSYPIRRPDGEGRDRILVYEDSDHDGEYEAPRVFLDDLNLVSGLEVGFGGVWIGQAPELLFVPDADHDAVPDSAPVVLLDGWGYQDTHETLNAFTWGPDGWLYGCHGVFTHSRVGAPGTPDDERVALNAGVWRYHPTRHEFEVFAWGSSNPWGVSFDARGEAFITACVIPHLYHVIQGARYQRQAGAHFDAHVYDDLKTIADHSHFQGSTPWEGNGHSDAVGGGHAHCGALIYQGDAFPEAYQGALFTFNVHGNRLNQERLLRSGSGFVGEHAPDFLLANDSWFRGVAVELGPDGALYMIDWYDPQACHSTSPEIWDRSNGRMYRVRHGALRATDVDLWAQSSMELVDLLVHESAWYRNHARRVLQERGADEDVRALLEQLVVERGASELDLLWSLHALGGLDAEAVGSLLWSGDEDVRAWTVRLALEQPGALANMAGWLSQRARDEESPVVRLAIASGLQRLPVEERWGVVGGLALHKEDEQDANLPLLLWYAFSPLVEADPARALRLAAQTRRTRLIEFSARRAAGLAQGLPALVQVLSGERSLRVRADLLSGMQRGLQERPGTAPPAGWGELAAELEQRLSLRESARAISAAFGLESSLLELRAALLDRARPDAERIAAIDGLVRARDTGALPLLYGALEQPSLTASALRGLAQLSDERLGDEVLAAWARFDPSARRAAVAALCTRVESARALLAAVSEGRVLARELSAAQLRQLQAFDDEELARGVEELWGSARAARPEARAEMARLSAALSPEVLAGADKSDGRAVWERTCAQCHTLFGAGAEVGPELTGSNRADLAYLLENVLDPNAVIPREYQATEVWLLDERLHTGLLVQETDAALTLRTETDTLLIARSEIDEVRLSEVSMMPEGLLDGLSEEELCALVAYVQGEEQVPVRLSEVPGERFFDGASLRAWVGDPALWRVEAGEIVGSAPQGLARNEFLASELLLSDFRLVFELRLQPDGENSGVQFRSQRHPDGDVSGYQADVGRGWWGNLYEEHGRGLLVDAAASRLVRRGDWNRYELLVVGDHVQTALNGRRCVDLVDPEGAREGVVALQMHSGGALEVRFRNFELELDPEPRLRTLDE